MYYTNLLFCLLALFDEVLLTLTIVFGTFLISCTIFFRRKEQGLVQKFVHLPLSYLMSTQEIDLV
jgi:hypothetical protein